MRPNKSFLLTLIYDARYRSITFQVLLLLSIIFGIWWVVDNTVTNLAAQNKGVGFGFLTQTSGFQISPTLGTWLFGYEVGKSSYLEVYYIGIVNTFIVAFFGIFAATILGFTLGIMRLSQNFIFRAFSTVYIEIGRNVPLLVQLFFWYFAVLRSLPSRRDKVELIPDMMGINITGLYIPRAMPEEGFHLTLYAFVIACGITWFTSRWAKKASKKQGNLPYVLGWRWHSVGLALVGLYGHRLTLGMGLSHFKETGPLLKRGYQAGTGVLVIPEMLAVWFALSVYTAAFIAEIVRAGIVAVPKGQTEASSALGIKKNHALRLVIIPQAMRIIIPPLTSQYLNLTKNSSLAVAIAYPELVSVFAGTALNQVGREIEMIFMTMAVYLTFSIVTAIFMNWFNARVKLVER